MEKLINYENIEKYDLTGLVIEECEKGPFTYLLIILNPSVPALEYPEKAYKNAIVKSFKWEQPGVGGGNEDNLTVLYNTIGQYREFAKINGYEFYAFCLLDEEAKRIKLVTEQLLTLAQVAEYYKEEIPGIYRASDNTVI